MFNSNNFKELQKMAEQAAKTSELHLKLLDETLKGTLQGVSDEKDKQQIERLMGMTTKAINLAKQGKPEQAQEIIKNFSDGRKSSKTSV